jgi:hypothetical protein
VHDVDALIAKSDHLAAAVSGLKNATLCPLAQGLSLLPITEALAEELTLCTPEVEGSLTKPLSILSDGLNALAVGISRETPVVYISTSYFGGHGKQDAVVWDSGSVRFSPVTKGYEQVWPNSPISQALRMIGVVANDREDEFDALGLGKHRKTQNWAESAKQPR